MALNLLMLIIIALFMSTRIIKIFSLFILMAVLCPVSLQAQWQRDPSGIIGIDDNLMSNSYTLDLGAVDNFLFKKGKTYLQFSECKAGSALIISGDTPVGRIDFEGALTRISIFTNVDFETLSNLRVNYAPSRYGKSPLEEINIYPVSNYYGQDYKNALEIEFIFNTDDPRLDIAFSDTKNIVVYYDTHKTVDYAMMFNEMRKDWTLQDYALYNEALKASELANKNFFELTGEAIGENLENVFNSLKGFAEHAWGGIEDQWEENPYYTPVFVVVEIGKGAGKMAYGIGESVCDAAENGVDGVGCLVKGDLSGAKDNFVEIVPSPIKKTAECMYYTSKYTFVERDKVKASHYFGNFFVAGTETVVWVYGAKGTLKGMQKVGEWGADATIKLAKNTVKKIDDVAQGINPTPALAFQTEMGSFGVIPGAVSKDGILKLTNLPYGSAGKVAGGAMQMSAASGASATGGASYKLSKTDIANSAAESGTKSVKIKKINGETVEGNVARFDEKSQSVWMKTKEGSFEVKMTEIVSMEWRVLPSYVPKGSLIEFSEQTGVLKWKKWETRTGRLIEETDDMFIVEIEGQVKNIKKANVAKPKVITDPFEPGFSHAVPRSSGEVEWLKISEVYEDAGVKRVKLETGKTNPQGENIVYRMNLDDMVEFETTYIKAFEAEYKRITEQWHVWPKDADPAFAPFKDKYRRYPDAVKDATALAEKEAFYLPSVGQRAKDGYRRKISDKKAKADLDRQNREILSAERELERKKAELAKATKSTAAKAKANELRSLHAKYMAEHPDYYERYLQAYERLEPGSKSPVFEMLEAERRTVNPDIHSAAIEEALKEIGVTVP